MNIDMVNIDQFSQYTETTYKRLTDLYEKVNAEPPILNLLPQALMELATISEILHLATEKLNQQNEELIQTQNLLQRERQRYYDLFEETPDAYLITDAIGKIQEVNHRASQLLNISQQSLLGKSIINFIAPEGYESFICFLAQLSQYDTPRELLVRFQQHNGESFDGNLKVVPVRQQGKIIALRWLLRDATKQRRAEVRQFNNNCKLNQILPVHKYVKGLTIPLDNSVIWYVCKGLVKLSTFCEMGEELLVGLAGEGMVFGSSMTSLDTYEATSLSDVELVQVHLSEIDNSPALSHVILPKIKQRLEQTESFLYIFGRRRVEDRLENLLQLLKQEIGQEVPCGTRLSVRFTHEELASACCTTRVTITRLLSKLQHQGKFYLDASRHMVFRY
jgi:PAS domain S-box-containing protein